MSENTQFSIWQWLEKSARRKAAIFSVIGYFSVGFGLTLFVPVIVSLIYEDGQAGDFLKLIVMILVPGLYLSMLGRKYGRELTKRDGFIIVAIYWIGISNVAAIPFIMSTDMSFIDALFEAISAFTTTGSTVISGLDELPKSLLFYRQQLQWLGGMGMIVLAVAILPLMGIGGMQLYKAEVPGPMKNEKITPRLAQSARMLWGIYVGITLLNAIAYWLAGMTPFDAIAHSLSTVSTGGFSTHDKSLGWYNSPAIESVAMFFMLLGAINFSIHFMAWRQLSFSYYLRDIETRSFLLIVFFAIIIVSLILSQSGEYPNLPPNLRNATFEVVSVITSTGFGTVDFSHWPDFLPVLLIFISFIGGCGGSTAGGVKVIRVLILVQLSWREVKRLISPNAIFPIRLGERVLNEKMLESILGYIGVYIFSFAVLMLLMMHTGLDQVSAFSAIATCMNNLGPGLGKVANTFADISDAGKLVAAFSMLLGRLEIFTLLVLISPGFWRR